mmetsp:Transcript_8396/g.21469  ORF Transcript_8396/g.21469 Transcript_8396/m.21469 type:complete len:85 (-) Transcript_8396:280-534(-)
MALTHAEVIAQNPLEAPAPFWDNVYYVCNGLAAFLILAFVLGAFVCSCLAIIERVERFEDRLSGVTARAASDSPGMTRKRNPHQ